MSSLNDQTITQNPKISEVKQTIENSDAPAPDHHQKPQSPSKVEKGNWAYVFKRAFNKFLGDGCTDLAASLTYFAVLSIFPALLAIVSLLGVFGQGKQTTDAILGFLGDYAPADMVNLISEPISQLTESSAAGFALVTGVVGALWTASGYVGGFSRALNKIYGVTEGRPFIKLKATMLAITASIVVLAVVMMLLVLTSNDVLQMVNDFTGIDISGFAAIWVWLRWPIMLVIAIVMIAILYYGTPNVKQPKLRWISPGAVFAIVAMGIAGAGFTFYVANFSKYNATYGLIGGVIVMLLFLWIMNNVLLLGAQIDAELERVRELQAGIKAEEDIQLPVRDDTQAIKTIEKEQKIVEEGRQIRLKNNGVDFAEMANAQDGEK